MMKSFFGSQAQLVVLALLLKIILLEQLSQFYLYISSKQCIRGISPIYPPSPPDEKSSSKSREKYRISSKSGGINYLHYQQISTVDAKSTLKVARVELAEIRCSHSVITMAIICLILSHSSSNSSHHGHMLRFSSFS